MQRIRWDGGRWFAGTSPEGNSLKEKRSVYDSISHSFSSLSKKKLYLEIAVHKRHWSTSRALHTEWGSNPPFYVSSVSWMFTRCFALVKEKVKSSVLYPRKFSPDDWIPVQNSVLHALFPLHKENALCGLISIYSRFVLELVFLHRRFECCSTIDCNVTVTYHFGCSCRLKNFSQCINCKV